MRPFFRAARDAVSHALQLRGADFHDIRHRFRTIVMRPGWSIHNNRQRALGIALSAVADIMVFISLDELVPVLRSFAEEHLSIVGAMVGMTVVALSL